MALSLPAAAHRRSPRLEAASGALQPGAAAMAVPPCSGVPERKAFRKPRRQRSDLCVIEGCSAELQAEDALLQGEDPFIPEAKRPRSDDTAADEDAARAAVPPKRRAGGRAVSGRDVDKALALLAGGFAEDYFLAPICGRPVAAFMDHIGKTPESKVSVAEPVDVDAPILVAEESGEDRELDEWLQLMKSGFSVLVSGNGSKFRLLETFASLRLIPWGASVVRMNAFAERFSLAETLRAILEQCHPGAPRLGAAVEKLVESIVAARSTVGISELRPLCLVVHNLDLLSQPHQVALSTLAARARRLHVVASVDNHWAAMTWTPRMTMDFSFAHVRKHTGEEYVAETASRFPSGLPAWANPTAARRQAPKARLSLVLRSLTNNHRELVQAMAERQLEMGGSVGVSMNALLAIATDRMIARQQTKLRSFLNELKDHDIVLERNGLDGSVLYQLPCDDRTLRCLADGENIASDGDDDEDANPAAGASRARD
eukprot:TRINITY_DN46096_c0_g1_i1.p1 TRINITY_DN46096_c0_g1~~TRINITY_DN46096_c0_g1_i1.p1  ORF type:complete len:510 (-),score=115.39 TRINITY_DN46096_c0_g1_i1:126-1586(-)